MTARHRLRYLAAIAAGGTLVLGVFFWAGPATTLPLGDASERRTLALAGDAGEREALTPPLPSRLSFDVTLPEGAYLELSPALVMESEVTRARVEFRVELEVEGEPEGESVRLWSRLLDISRANLWHDERFDLSAWEGRDARVVLEARTDPPRERVLWADRVQVVWGSPRIVSDPRGRAFEALGTEVSNLTSQFERQAARAGVSIEDRIQLREFGVNLAIAGLVALGLARAMPGAGSSLVPLLALATTLVIAVVHLSVPLSLGLIGALSILRFRTAVPRGRDLAYLSAAVAIGLALGAGERVVAAVGGVIVSALLYVSSRSRPERSAFRVRDLEVILPPNRYDALVAFGLPGELREVTLGRASTRVSVTLPPQSDELAIVSTLWKAFPEARARFR